MLTLVMGRPGRLAFRAPIDIDYLHARPVAVHANDHWCNASVTPITETAQISKAGLRPSFLELPA